MIFLALQAKPIHIATDVAPDHQAKPIHIVTDDTEGVETRYRSYHIGTCSSHAGEKETRQPQGAQLHKEIILAAQMNAFVPSDEQIYNDASNLVGTSVVMNQNVDVEISQLLL